MSSADVLKIRNSCHSWDDFLADHAHLNDHGHDRIAEMILEATRSDRLTGTKPPC